MSHPPANLRPDLLQPARIGGLSLPNRIVMAPMTRNRADEHDAPHALNVEYYRQRAGAGLIITEASQVSPQGKGYPRTPGIYSAEQVAGWRQVTDAVHAAGGRIFLQLWHVGRISHPSTQPDGALPVAPSAIAAEGTIPTESGPQPFVVPRALKTAEIPGIVAQFRRGTLNARAAGFDGVEIHGANGYLVDQFLRDGTNRRTDLYGGSIENRTRFLREAVEAVIDAWGAAGRVGVRLSPLGNFNSMSDSDPQRTFGHAAEALRRYGLAYLHVVEGGHESAEGSFDWADLKRRFGGPYMANGGYDSNRAEAVLAEGRADLVSFATPYIANPDLAERFRRGLPLAESDRATFYGGDDRGYTDYPPAEPHHSRGRTRTPGAALLLSRDR
jgi:N-ethylmaleimide reductase